MVPVFLLITTIMSAQNPTPGAAGIFYLQSVMETASGFKLDADGGFEFFFSQGALDRYASGQWKQEGTRVIFNSKPRPAQDFALLQNRQADTAGVVVQITDANSFLLDYVHLTIEGGGQKQKLVTDRHGAAYFKPQPIETISLQFEFCPEKISVFRFTDAAQANNYFSFRYEPWLFELFLENFELKLTNTGLMGGHPLLRGNEYQYRRANQ